MKFFYALQLSLFLSVFVTAQTVDIPDDSLVFSGNENNGIVNLYWKTTSKINMDHFIIERSNDGKDFITIGSEAASPNDSESPSYNLADKQPVDGKNYYRLVSIDVNGGKKYSNTILIDTKQTGKTDFVLTPNPSHAQTTISISGILKGKISIILYDLNGSKIDELYSGELNSDAFSTTFSVANLKKGIYIISVHIGSEYTRKKLVVE